MTDLAIQPAELIAAMVLEDGQTWGSVAAQFQIDDVEAIFAGDVLWHFLTRPRGGSKSTDLAAVLLAWLVCVAGPSQHGYIIATDRDQGSFAVLDALTGLVRRTPSLRGLVDVQASKVVGPSGATVEVLSADGASTWGLRPAFIVCDEVAQWPGTRNARSVWTALISATGKMPDCRLICLTSSGEPSHWSHKVFKTAQKSARWRVNAVPGPLQWADPKNLADQRLLLTDSQYARLHLNQWTEAEDRLVTAEDLEAATRATGEDILPRPGVRYVVTLDMGLVRDRTVVMVAHKEDVTETVVIDVVRAWQGSRRQKVSIKEVGTAIIDLHRLYPGEVFIDLAKAEGIEERLRDEGIPISEFTFGTTSVGILASALIRALRAHTLSLPNDPALLEELLTVRIVENAAGVARLGHDSDKHDDYAVAAALAVYKLTAWRPVSRMIFADSTPTHAPDGTPLLPVLAGTGFAGQFALPAKISGNYGDPEPGGGTMKSPYV